MDATILQFDVYDSEVSAIMSKTNNFSSEQQQTQNFPH